MPKRLPSTQGATPLCVLAALQQALNDQPNHAGYVSSAWLQTTTGLSRRGVQYGIRVLEQNGQLRVTSGRGRGNQSHYRLLEAPAP